MGALIPIFIQFLPYLVKAAQAVPEVIDFVKRTQQVLKQSKEWTQAEQDTFDAHLEEITSQEHWKPDANS